MPGAGRTVKTAALGLLVTVSMIVPPEAAADAASSGLAVLTGGDGVGEGQGAGAAAGGVARGAAGPPVEFSASFGVPVTTTALLNPTVIVMTEPTP